MAFDTFAHGLFMVHDNRRPITDAVTRRAAVGGGDVIVGHPAFSFAIVAIDARRLCGPVIKAHSCPTCGQVAGFAQRGCRKVGVRHALRGLAIVARYAIADNQTVVKGHSNPVVGDVALCAFIT